MLIGCESNRYRRSVSSYYSGNYTIAIEEIDTYLKEAENGAYKTNAELIRSKAYQQLALKAYSANNLALATRFAMLSNSVAVDSLLARCYYDYANLSFQKEDKVKGFEFYDQLLLEIPNSRFTTEVIYAKMKDVYTASPDNYPEAWQYYKKLFPDYKDDYYEVEARKFVAQFSARYVSDALAAETQKGLEMLLEFNNYPVAGTQKTKDAIAQIYIRTAEKAIRENNFMEADNSFKSAVYFDPSVKDFVKQRLLDTAEQYIVQGQELVKQRDFEKAFILFNRTFDVIPGYKKALQAIQETTELLHRIEEAKNLYTEAQGLEKVNLRVIYPNLKLRLAVSERNEYEIKRFQRILGLYQQAYKLDPLPLYYQQIFYTGNIIKYYQKPDEFTVEIIKEYKSFIVENALNEARAYLLKNNTSSTLTDTGWEVLVASGAYQYEVRYTMISMPKKLYFRWLVNLKTKEITAINSLSEQAMKGKFVNNEEEIKNEKID